MNNQLITCRVCGEEKDLYSVLNAQGEILHAEISGKMRLDDTRPAVGDWITGTLQPGNWVYIEEILERRTCLQRKDIRMPRPQIFASNVDVMFVVTSANQDLSLNRLDRYLAMAFAGGIQPVILLNKVDLVDNPGEILDQLMARFPNVNIHGLSVLENLNKEIFDGYFANGETAVFVGSSGVGKSSLTNWITGKNLMVTQNIREDDDKGKHTTTSRSLHALPGGGWVVDTPGIRQLALVDAGDGVDEVFQDILDLATECRFGDCQHKSEPGCAILAALETGGLPEERWQSFLKLQRETQFHERKENKFAEREHKRKLVLRQREYKRVKSEKARR